MTHASTVGIVRGLYCYPVKSLVGFAIDQADVGWHGFAHDRRYAFARAGDSSGFPWLTATKMPALLGYAALAAETSVPQVRTPSGRTLAVTDPALSEELSHTFGAPVFPMKLDIGIFDHLALSLITTQAIASLGAQVGRTLEVERFRPNILVEALSDDAFPEDNWLDGLLEFGENDTGPAMRVNERDQRCVMVNIAPDTLEKDAAVLRAIAQTRQSCLGVYGSTEQRGVIRVGDVVRLKP